MALFVGADLVDQNVSYLVNASIRGSILKTRWASRPMSSALARS